MNGKWQLNKVGLLDFWYYDEEEFTFSDGRMLLRGANGSGKSVTMQSFIPLLLDGNMRPERLDPFGSRARKMENYLLEEGDEREERTGYLYMELKRQKSEEYLTLGIGIRARKNRKLESWYFCITDGRRVGKDIYLYKDTGSKITCSKGELKYRIGDGGKVMETQGEYASLVNRLLFGFETQGEYRELLDLLIQLRTPKLSKDFKPTVINEILSSSLQTLSEEDLRPMSEAIENMDNLKTNLDTLKEGIHAAKQIERVYDQYNQIVLYDKALLFMDVFRAYEDSRKYGEELLKKQEENVEAVHREEEHYEQLKREEDILKEEKESLHQSDAAKLKEQEIKVSEELTAKQEERQQKERQEEEKKEKRLDAEEKIREEEEKSEKNWADIEEQLYEMEEELGEIPFDEFAFFKKELCEAREDFPAFSTHRRLLEEYMAKVENGEKILLKEREQQRKYDGYLVELEQAREKRNQAEREFQQFETLLYEIKSELKEKMYLWEKENAVLHPDTSVMQEMSRRIEEYEMGKDISEIRDTARNTMFEMERGLEREKGVLEKEKEDVENHLSEARTELAQWTSLKDPEPERPDSVKASREWLREKGIPYLPFYQTLDFAEQMKEEERGRLEEALLSMGVLDALVVSEEYRDEIYAMEDGLCDKYIFSDVETVRDNLMEVLQIDNEDNDILLYQSISRALSSIGWKSAPSGGPDAGESGQTKDGRPVLPNTWIRSTGGYRLGILEGTVTKEYTAHFIGAQSRERYRQEKIREWTVVCEELSRKDKELAGALQENRRRMETLRQEWNRFPAVDDLKTAAKSCADSEYALEQRNSDVRKWQEETEKQRKELDNVRIEAREICKKAYLAPRLDVFLDALEALRRYKESLASIQVSHGRYQNSLRYMQMQQEYLEELARDLDDILYEKGRILSRERELEEMLVSVRKQLSMTDYAQIRERLDYCLLRLGSLPKERETSVGRQADLRKEGENLREKSEENARRGLQLLEKKERYQQIFEEEYRLGYVKDMQAEPEEKHIFTEGHTSIEEDVSIEEKAQKICAAFAGTFGSRKQSDLFGSLQEVYHQNRAYLLDYHITLHTLFEELDEDTDFTEVTAKRIDITAKYRGTSVKFKELLGKMDADAEMLSKLLSEKDRELFEDILANTISKKIRAKIQASKRWVAKMNELMESMRTSSGLKLSLRWKSRRAEKEEQLDTRELVALLEKDVEIMRREEIEKLSAHFRSKIEEARSLLTESGSVQSFHATMREVLDYRKWFEFQIECQKTGEKKKELTDRVFFTFSGGEKAMAMYVPLFSAVVAKYAGARPDAPKLISLDEAFAGVDETNIRDMFRLMVEFDFNFMINSQILWGDYDTVPALAIYQLIRPENAKYVSVIHYTWNGKRKIMETGK